MKMSKIKIGTIYNLIISCLYIFLIYNVIVNGTLNVLLAFLIVGVQLQIISSKLDNRIKVDVSLSNKEQ